MLIPKQEIESKREACQYQMTPINCTNAWSVPPTISHKVLWQGDYCKSLSNPLLYEPDNLASLVTYFDDKTNIAYNLR